MMGVPFLRTHLDMIIWQSGTSGDCLIDRALHDTLRARIQVQKILDRRRSSREKMDQDG